jgi:hypothetical protein
MRTGKLEAMEVELAGPNGTKQIVSSEMLKLSYPGIRRNRSPVLAPDVYAGS